MKPALNYQLSLFTQILTIDLPTCAFNLLEHFIAAAIENAYPTAGNSSLPVLSNTDGDTRQHCHPEKQIQNCMPTLAKDGRRQEQKRHFLDAGICAVGIMRLLIDWIAAL